MDGRWTDSTSFSSRDYDRAFSATLRGTTFRTLLAIAAGKKLRLMQIDVSNAFSQADMDDHFVVCLAKVLKLASFHIMHD